MRKKKKDIGNRNFLIKHRIPVTQKGIEIKGRRFTGE